MTRRRGAPLAAGVAVMCLTACSGGGSGAPKTPSTTTAPVVAATIAPVKPQREILADKDIVEVPALRKTITMTACRAADKGWAGSGTARNPGSAATTYHILVLFTDRYSRTIDYARTDVHLAAGATAAWSAATAFDPPQGIQCVLRGLSQTPAA